MKFLYLQTYTVLLLMTFLGCEQKLVDKPMLLNKGSEKDVFKIKGISLVAPVRVIDSSAMAPVLNVNANSIAIMPYAFCSVANPAVKYNSQGQWWGESDAGVLGTIAIAHSKNLTVMLKPHLWLSRGEYTGKLNFDQDTAWVRWEQTYSDYILHFAQIAQDSKVDLFCFSTELGGPIKARPQFFQTLITAVKAVYKGKITYAGNWDDYANFPFWKQMDYVGVDAYFPISKSATPTIEEITEGWQPHLTKLEKLSKQLKLPIMFTEYGYRNADFAAQAPWEEANTQQNDIAQSNALEGFYTSIKGKSWFAGGYLWKWYVDEPRRRNRTIDFTPQGKKAEVVVKQWYGK